MRLPQRSRITGDRYEEVNSPDQPFSIRRADSRLFEVNPRYLHEALPEFLSVFRLTAV